MTAPADTGDALARIVFVCTGNRARSALAAALLRRRAEDLPVIVESRGTTDVGGAPVLPEMLRAGDELQLDLSQHRAVALGRGEFSGADLVLGFEQYHVAAAVVDGGADHSRTFTLPELVELASPPTAGDADLHERIAHVTAEAHRRRVRGGTPPEVRDPLGASREEFRETAIRIDRLVDEVAALVFGPVDSRASA